MKTKVQSKRLSYLLRHAPEDAGITLDKGGWVAVAELLAGLAQGGTPMTEGELRTVVETNDKKRFTLSEDGLMIRAAQGHSVKIENDLTPVTPPDFLYHGTAVKTLSTILTEGLKPMSRLHVHLSPDVETAVKVGKRHGKPTVLTVQTKQMAANGHEFFQADNGVWLTASVPPHYLTVEGSES